MTDQNQDEMIADVDENEIVSEASMSDDPKNAETASVTELLKQLMLLQSNLRLKPRLA